MLATPRQRGCPLSEDPALLSHAASPPFRPSLSLKEGDSYHVQSVPLGGERGPPMPPRLGVTLLHVFTVGLFLSPLFFPGTDHPATTLYTRRRKRTSYGGREKENIQVFCFTNHLGYSRPDQAAKPGITPIPEGLRAGVLVCVVFTEKVAHCWSCYLPSPTGIGSF